ncbi:transcriptional regulator GlxA family with amidase domain [Catenulispora sp. GP43]|uniref:GlxA family transcriptional regulator n=1 Tax=Catenulispora sp. GP43 TaxID=3156263 RepID=UPI003514788D
MTNPLHPASPSHRVVFLVVPPVMAHDLSVAQAILGDAGQGAYDLRVTTPDPGLVETVAGPELAIREGLEHVGRADTVFVIGGGARPGIDDRVAGALRTAAAAGKRIVGCCTGVFVLARAGLLDGRRATTHWHLLDRLAEDHPRITVEHRALYVEDGPVLTSAGAAAVIELCLHLIRSDHGAAAAVAAGDLVVAGPARSADHPQPTAAAAPAKPRPDRSLAATRAWAHERLSAPLALADLAAHAKVSERTLTRRFHAETGLSPLQWLLRQRIDRARQLLETTDLTMDRVAEHCGLGSPDSLRHHFVTHLGQTPSSYRTRWR